MGKNIISLLVASLLVLAGYAGMFSSGSDKPELFWLGVTFLLLGILAPLLSIFDSKSGCQSR